MAYALILAVLALLSGQWLFSIGILLFYFYFLADDEPDESADG